MVTKNSLFILSLVAIVSFTVSCTTKDKKPTVPEIVDDSDSSVPTATIKTLPRIGVILGPGGMNTYAHLGVIKELEKANIPIHAVTGTEWGALMAALYSAKGKSHDMEWKLQKLTSDFVPQKTLFQTKMAPQSFKRIQPYIQESFGRTGISGLAVKFSCPARSVTGQRSTLISSGRIGDAIMKCLPHPPFFENQKGWVADTLSVEDQVAWLKDQGADVVIYIDVLKDSAFHKMASIQSDEPSKILWDHIKQEATPNGAGNTIRVFSVKLSEADLADFDSRKKHIISGQQAGLRLAEDLKDEYGF